MFLPDFLESPPLLPSPIMEEPKRLREARIRSVIKDNTREAVLLFLLDVVLCELFGDCWQESVLDLILYGILQFESRNTLVFLTGTIFLPMILSLGGINILATFICLAWNKSPIHNSSPLASITKLYRVGPNAGRNMVWLAASCFGVTGLVLPPMYHGLRWMIGNFYLRCAALVALVGVTFHFFSNLTIDPFGYVSRLVIKTARQITVQALILRDQFRDWLSWCACRFMTQRLKDYEYEPLNRANLEFRLLRLHPASSDDPLIQCSLLRVPFNDHYDQDNYEAVSYRWGSGRPIYPIVINGSRFLVSRTVFRLLRALQLRDQSRDVWIDTLCINQAPESRPSSSASLSGKMETKKVYQLGLMGLIYRGASNVVCWIGEGAKGQGTLSFIRDSRNDAPETAQYLEFPELLEGLWPWDILNTWLRVTELFQTDYFSRMWMLQEVGLGKRVILKHGKEEIDWELFQKVVAFLLSSQGEKFLHEPALFSVWYVNPDVLNGVKSAATMEIMRTLVNSNGVNEDEIRKMPMIRQRLANSMRRPKDEDDVRRLPLETLLGLSTDFSATNVKDKIYALLGMTMLETRQQILPDYDDAVLPPSQLLRDIAKLLLTSKDETLDHLHNCGWGYAYRGREIAWAQPLWRRVGHRVASLCGWTAADQGIHLPSWVPEWTLGRIQKPVIEGGAMYGAGLQSDKRFEAIPGRSDCIRASISTIDTIRRLSEPFPCHGDYDPPQFPQLFKVFMQQVLQLAECVPSHRLPDGMTERDEALWRTIFGDYASGHQPPLESGILQRFKAAAMAVAFEPITSSIDSQVVEDVQPAIMELGRTISGHRFCVTTNGAFGLVPERSCVGDDVVIIWGSSTPFIMRSGARHRELVNAEPGQHRPLCGELQGDENVLMGSCYVHGLMLGEAKPRPSEMKMAVLR
ncbi:heterokaryon incompatibility protein-domain-containing protein [Podospora australis]|uniref:Heterokaryon incompatibility protein-domain-containing protein n=1 Tax=Podospora australis TaxID=1536484 RepID=A0AAN6WVE0_9PEZI|nr:heterokaryon incompatibility protein-domain-containing protein [Podospora australis]